MHPYLCNELGRLLPATAPTRNTSAHTTLGE